MATIQDVIQELQSRIDLWQQNMNGIRPDQLEELMKLNRVGDSQLLYLFLKHYKEMVAVLKGARDTLDDIPEGVPGNHDSRINRSIRRIETILGEE